MFKMLILKSQKASAILKNIFWKAGQNYQLKTYFCTVLYISVSSITSNIFLCSQHTIKNSHTYTRSQRNFSLRGPGALKLNLIHHDLPLQ